MSMAFTMSAIPVSSVIRPGALPSRKRVVMKARPPRQNRYMVAARGLSDMAEAAINHPIVNNVADMASMVAGTAALDVDTSAMEWAMTAALVLGISAVAVAGVKRMAVKSATAKNDTNVTFDDVAGATVAKADLVEVVDFLKNPNRYTALGAKIPRGILLTGPPGCGKTLLARAVAGEAKVPFIAVSASSFIEMFAGLGAKRIRELFDKAAKAAPCIIFVDEIDAVGRQRPAASLHAGNDERDQTINQLLVCMDGFEKNPGVIVLAATNRDDVLDPALTRPGRFDRKITVDLPDINGRLKILEVHCNNKPLKDVDLQSFARRTPGFSGAELANVCNEAAILGAARNLTQIGTAEMEDALDRIMIGAVNSGALLSPETIRIVAYHEAGHALVATMLADPEAGPAVHKVSIIRRGESGGVTMLNPDESHGGIHQRQYFENQLAIAMGGRAAEEIVFDHGQVTSGAVNDIERATAIARLMVTRLGLVDDIGPVLQDDHMSEKQRQAVDDAVTQLVCDAKDRASEIIILHMDWLRRIAGDLIEYEILSSDDIHDIINSAAVHRSGVGRRRGRTGGRRRLQRRLVSPLVDRTPDNIDAVEFDDII